MEIVSVAWPELEKLSKIISPRFCPPTVNMPYESVSDPKIFSQIYFLMSRPTPMGWAEIISHELGHQYLFVVYSAFHKKVDAPWKENFYSAIRRTQRPLIGILHGTVAEAFMIQLAKSVLNRPDLHACHHEAEELFERQAKSFALDFETIAKYQAHHLHPSFETMLTSVLEWVR
jgi:hypothetical protein